MCLHAISATMRLKSPSSNPLSQIPIREASANGNLYDWYHALIDESRYLLFQSNHSLYTSKLSFDATFSFIEVITAVITALALLCKYIMGTFVDLALLMTILTLWSPVCDLENLLKFTSFTNSKSLSTIIHTGDIAAKLSSSLNSKSETFQSTFKVPDLVIKRYESLCELSKLLNNGLGEVLVPFILEGVFTYAINFNDILFLGEFSHGVVVFSFYAIFLLILQMASSICRKVNTLLENEYSGNLLI